MPGENLTLSKSSLAFAKLAATPTEKAWSQAYNAGNLFACLSLVSQEGEELHELQTLGKDLFSNLEAEFFTLEEKNLATISDAITKSTKHIPETITVNFCLGFFKDSALYLFILGGGRVVMKRGNKLGILLEKSETKQLQTASGLLENDDTIILETRSFATNVSDAHLRESLQLNLPSDIAESLSMHMHEKADGDQAAIIVVYHGATAQQSSMSYEHPSESEKTLAEAVAKEEIPTPRRNFAFPTMPKIPRITFLTHLTHRKKLFLSVSLIILILLIISVSFTKQQQDASKNKELFQSIYGPALKNYEEGKGLANLNPTLSQEDFEKAAEILTQGKDILPQGSKEDQQIEDLLVKVQEALASKNGSTAVQEVTLEKTAMLSLEKENNNASAFNQNSDSVFFVTTNEAIAVSKKSGDEKTLVENDDDWDNALAIVPYQANFYILDPKNGVLKYVPSGNTYTKNDYFTAAIDLSKASSMAIDSAIWILFSDGTLNKYLRGEKQNFAFKDLPEQIGSGSKIVTDADMENLYILDPNNARIVSFAKDGTFQKQYTAGILQDAKDFVVLEKDKKIQVLSGGKIFELDLD